MSTRVCAIAKDEGAYLAEWVFHHIYFGFDNLHIYLNRTSDSSKEILDAIINNFPQVSYEELDWVDNCTPDVARRLQILAYGKDLQASRDSNVDWWLCLDIDEYWMPKDFKTPVESFVSSFSTVSPVCFLWHNICGELKPFSEISPDSNYNITPQLKTITPIKLSEIEFVRIHKPRYCPNVRPLNANGDFMVFDKNVDQRADKSMRINCQAYIAHKVYRSEPEYLAAMIRGRPDGRVTLKTNRPGFKLKKDGGNQEKLNLDKKEYESYIIKKNEFLNKINVDDLINRERERVLSASRRVEDIVKNFPEHEDFDGVLKSLEGTYLHSLLKSSK